MSFLCPACNYTAKSAHGLSMHQNQWCKGLRDASNNVMNACHERQAPQPPPAPHAQSEAPLLNEPSLNKANQPEFENPEPYELPVHHLPSPPPLARASDELPALPMPVPIPPPVDDVAHAVPQSPVHSDSGTTESEGEVWVHTEQDTVGTFHSYQGTFPSYDPENTSSFNDGVILADDFEHEDLRDSKLFSTSDKWHEASVNIKLPAEKHRYASEADAPDCAVDGLYYRKPLEVIRSAYEEVTSKSFHNVPYKLFWQPDEGEFPERIIMEVYTANAMLKEHVKIKAQPHEPGCQLETVVASIMLWSDSTHLASFGHAVLWPIYMFIGNQSKYIRNCPSAFTAHHLAYIPKLPDIVHEYHHKLYGQAAMSAVLTHLKRELMQAIWLFLLDEEFMHAYEHGIVLTILKRFFSHASNFPCPCCLIPKEKIADLVTKLDRLWCKMDVQLDNHTCRSIIERVHDWIFTKGRNIGSTVIDKLLGPMSLVPTRILHAFGGDTMTRFDARFHCVPTFGRDTIQMFSWNVSNLTKLAVRDYEDLLQCCIPVMEGLLPDHDEVILDLLFELATWHALGKLQMHTETTLNFLDNLTTRLGQALCRFKQSTCDSFITQELPKEAAARGRQKPAYSAKGKSKAMPAKKGNKSTTEGTQQQYFNMSTYKLHALGDYVKSIWLFGTTDNFSTQVKAAAQQAEGCLNHTEDSSPSVGFAETESLPQCSPETQYQISNSHCQHWDITSWLHRNHEDLAVKDFLPRLKDHILTRFLGYDDSEERTFTAVQRNSLIILDNKIYKHKVLRVNYTTYDLRRAQDSLNPRTHADIMLPGNEESEPGELAPHPHWYARIISIFHVYARYLGPDSDDWASRHVDFLWVCWFCRDSNHKSGNQFVDHDMFMRFRGGGVTN
ncbi:hypothetical protein F4604DRAFT_2020743 [Suillus subluteus]|nr:hypothetical protein F4604DRAFT_2020743 [Suillus subluteus]